MQERTYTIIEQAGIHARPAATLVKTAGQFNSEINLEYKDKKVNLKSIMGLLSLAIPNNAEVKISAEGSDEVDAINGLDEVLQKEGLAK